MKILLIRHGEPNYEKNCLTIGGRQEADLLSKKLLYVPIDYVYISPYGRAAETAQYTLTRKEMSATVLSWMHEINIPDMYYEPKNKYISCPVGFYPSDWMEKEANFDKDKWQGTEFYAKYDIKKETENIRNGFDDLLRRHGYERNGYMYKAVQANSDTLALFCHEGVINCIMAHVLNISPAITWNLFYPQTSSVTTLMSEEQEKGIAVFKLVCYGDTSHLPKKERIDKGLRKREMYTNV